ncbi:hypothetical protein OPU71_13960 [Niveibacterium sp. 24ML]|uniref:hypothetical protein n=1 Tax=Niveibacterium sp. 24ML TaxID=2985512 RepID=UPI00227018BE|nr:hypothetical protein [Niveibacterium sp. 24ML]MCX9157232.1 hypothetical protein [Niveibacterium sp. 24ML]
MSIPIVVQIYLLAIVVSFAVAALVHVLVAWLAASEQSHASPVQAPVQDDAAGRLCHAGVTPAQVAAIAGALSEVLGAHRIVRIESAERHRTWVSGARAAQHESHHLARSPGRSSTQ